MPKRKEPEQFASKGEKDNWHPYSLQDLAPNKFAQVVTKILGGSYGLVNSKPDNRVTANYTQM